MAGEPPYPPFLIKGGERDRSSQHFFLGFGAFFGGEIVKVKDKVNNKANQIRQR